MLKYDLHKFERAFAFQITEQSKEYSVTNFTASNGWKVSMSVSPEIDVLTQTIWLRGEDSDKNLRVNRVWDLSSNWLRDEIVDAIDLALNEYKSWVKWYANSTTPFAVAFDLVMGATSKTTTSDEGLVKGNIAKGTVITA